MICLKRRNFIHSVLMNFVRRDQGNVILSRSGAEAKDP
jgi:hypothetical protein